MRSLRGLYFAGFSLSTGIRCKFIWVFTINLLIVHGNSNSRPKRTADFFVLGQIPPPLNFAKIHARGARGLQRIAPRDLIPPPPAHVSAAQAIRLWLPSALSSTVHTHSNEALRQTSCIAIHHQSISQRVASYQLRRAPPHTTCSSRLPTRAAVLRTFGTSRVSSFFPRNSPIGQHAPTWPQIRPNPVKPNGSKPHSRFTPLLLALLHGHHVHAGAIS